MVAPLEIRKKQRTIIEVLVSEGETPVNNLRWSTKLWAKINFPKSNSPMHHAIATTPLLVNIKYLANYSTLGTAPIDVKITK